MAVSREQIDMLASKFGLGLMEAQSLLVCLNMHQKAEQATDFNDLKHLMEILVKRVYGIDSRYPIDDIKEALSKT